MNTSLYSAFVAHSIGVEDKAGISKLDIWIASNLNCDDKRRDEIIRELAEIIKTIEMKKNERWSTFAYTVSKLKLRSDILFPLVDRKLSKDRDKCDTAYDLFSAWDSFVKLGGTFLPVELSTRLSWLRKHAAPLWFDLAIIAYGTDYRGLIVETVNLLDEKLISDLDFQERYRDISYRIGSDQIVRFIVEVVAKIQDRKKSNNIQDWAIKSLGLNLGKTSGTSTKQEAGRKNLKRDYVIEKIENLIIGSGVFSAMNRTSDSRVDQRRAA